MLVRRREPELTEARQRQLQKSNGMSQYPAPGISGALAVVPHFTETLEQACFTSANIRVMGLVAAVPFVVDQAGFRAVIVRHVQRHAQISSENRRAEFPAVAQYPDGDNHAENRK